ncbi:ABC transporter permease [Mucilaginibacter sp. KACC 22063]|uniref:ABC transporter permease n=1 Tax=Mucilaginibacter sp. KACC 22063 TaxID=3025666 RepID=UPI00236719C3|nr:ABC transporter permease [Mucilaginibacter sp. KACC 22063]WDF53875.1 ABC transporter permease [Mucilaginibacter sp. KACC 22063]
MIKNYLKIAFRQLRKQRLYAAIKIGGFSLGIAACLLIALYIKFELSYDKAYPDDDRIYRVVMSYTGNGRLQKGLSMPAPAGKAIKSDFPEVEKSGRLMTSPLFWGAGSNELRPADQVQNTYEEGFAYIDQETLDILKLSMIYGSNASALAEPLTMLISKRKADKYFPGQNPVGKVMYLNDDKSRPYKIGGVMANIPQNSHLRPFDFFLTLTGKELWQGEQTQWSAWNYTDYIKLKQGVDPKAFEKKLYKGLMKSYFIPEMVRQGDINAAQESGKFGIYLQPISDVNLRSYDIGDSLTYGDIRFVWLFGAVAAFILTIACINFINLSTAKSANRAKEVGLRKVVGSHRSSLINQFLTESLIYSVISFVLGVLIAWLLLPYFNILSSRALTIPWLSWWFLPVIIFSAIIVGLAAGLYPAFYLSGFKPVQVLKGSVSTGSKNSVLRNSLVVFQFTVSIILIISTIVVYNQMQFILNRKVGFDKDQVLLIQGTNTLTNDKVKDLKNELSKLSMVKSVSISDYLPINGSKRNGNGFFIEGRNKLDPAVSGQFWDIDDTYLKTLGIKLLAGRNFSYSTLSTDEKGLIINQSMAKKLNLINPVGRRISNGGEVFTIIGLVQDFNFNSMREEVSPLALHFGLSPSIVSLKIAGTDARQAINAVSSVWKSFSPDQPIRFTFMDEQFANMYSDVQRTGHIFTSFAVLAIAIACLGLFALSAFMAEQRSKEIGIRKVLGASIHGITTMLSFDFVKLVIIAILIGSPVAWWGMNKWLQDFAYRTPIQWWIFLLAGLSAIFLALITVSFQSIKAAMMNPVKSLKSE